MLPALDMPYFQNGIHCYGGAFRILLWVLVNRPKKNIKRCVKYRRWSLRSTNQSLQNLPHTPFPVLLIGFFHYYIKRFFSLPFQTIGISSQSIFILKFQHVRNHLKEPVKYSLKRYPQLNNAEQAETRRGSIFGWNDNSSDNVGKKNIQIMQLINSSFFH